MDEYFGFRNFRQFERTHREIKLPYDLLNDIRFRQLPDARKAHLICLLLLSVRMNNLLPNSSVKLERLIGATEPLDLSAFADFVDFAGVKSRRGRTALRTGACPTACARRCWCATEDAVEDAGGRSSWKWITLFRSARGARPKNRTFKPCAAAATGPSPGSWSPGSED